MRLSHRLVERYIATAILPYLGLALLLLTTMLLAQQATRFAEILGNARTPLTLTIDVLLGLLPNILLFTLPMAVLVGTATGFSRLGSDSELVAMKAAGVGNLRIVAPVMLLGVLATGLALYDGLALAPESAQQLRHTALRAALYKLESPVEPNTFNTELPGKVIYVRDGDLTSGQWGRVFIHWQEEQGPTRIVTARAGRIDTSREQSELLLSDAVVTTLPATGEGERLNTGQIITEHSGQLRVRLDTGRDALIRKLQTAPAEPDEMKWQELMARSRTAQGSERRKVVLIMHRRLALCCAPLALALLGAGLGVRVRRGGRGLGVLLSLAALVVYYLLLLLGEQLGRNGMIAPQFGPWLASALTATVGGLLLLGERRLAGRRGGGAPDILSPSLQIAGSLAQQRWRYGLLGLLDRSVLRALAGNFVLAESTLICIFLIFTLFELLRFTTAAKVWLLARYLFFLIPLASTGLAPVAALISVLVSYALLARRSESVAWWAAGQSTYRLALPSLLFAVLVGGGLWLTQEHLLPSANRRQEALRGQIRGTVPQAVTAVGRQWLTSPGTQRLYSYYYEGSTNTLSMPVIFELDREGIHVQRIITGARGSWSADHGLRVEQPQLLDLAQPQRAASGAPPVTMLELPEPVPTQMFKPMLNKPAELNTPSLRSYAVMLKARSGLDARVYEVALARRWSDPFAPFVMSLLGLPLALAFGRRTALAALSLAVGVGVVFWGSVSGFQQLSLYNMLPPPAAAWSPLLIFTAVGAYLLSHTRT